MNKKDQKLNLPSKEQEKQYQVEFIQAIKKVNESRDYFVNIRYSVWSNIIQFNSILIGAFSVVISINKNLNDIHYFIFYIIAFTPIVLIMINYYIMKSSMHDMLENAVSDMKLKLPAFRKVQYILDKNAPNSKEQHNRNIKKKHKPKPKKVSTIEMIAVAFSLIAFAYFIVAIYFNVITVKETETEQIIVDCFFWSIKFIVI